MKSTVFETDMGWIGVAASKKGLRRVTLPCATSHLAQEALEVSAPEFGAADPGLASLSAQLQGFLSGSQVAFDVPLDLEGCSPFRRAVLKAVSRIPYGETRSYAQIACEVGRPGAARAVGRVMATNPLPLVVPCHRVLASDGTLCGFGGGLAMKQRLLDMERSGRKKRKGVGPGVRPN